jgi:hypothetical protein
MEADAILLADQINNKSEKIRNLFGKHLPEEGWDMEQAKVLLLTEEMEPKVFQYQNLICQRFQKPRFQKLKMATPWFIKLF